MKVRCISDYVTPDQRAALGRKSYQGTLALGLTIGKEYLVYALEYIADPDHFQTGLYVIIQPDVGWLVRYELCLFEITDPRPSRYWELRVLDISQTVLGPPSMYEDPEAYWEGFENDNAAVWEDYARLTELLTGEYDNSSY